jgi:hypothetical protein
MSGLDYPVERAASSKNSAFLVTTAVGHTPPWGQAFPIRRQIPACVGNTIGIDSTDQAELLRAPY